MNASAAAKKDAAALLAGAKALERCALGNERFPSDICTCNHARDEHLGSGLGCVGGWTIYCDCKRFYLDAEHTSNMVARTHRNAIGLLRSEAARPPRQAAR